MPINYSVLKELTSASFVGRLVSLEQRTVGSDPNRPPREVVRVEVWSADGLSYADHIPTGAASAKRREWVRRVGEILASESVTDDDDEKVSLLTRPRQWEWRTGGGGEYTYTVLLPGKAVEPPQPSDADLEFLAVLSGIAAGATPEQPFRFSSLFGNDLATAIPGSEKYGSDSTRWVRALHVMGLAVAEPGGSPDEVVILEVKGI